jgi:hypothetical protein
VGPRCSFCGATIGPFLEVGGAFQLLMCGDCQAARGGTRTAAPTTQPAKDEPAELLADHDPGRPWYQWGLCAVRSPGHLAAGAGGPHGPGTSRLDGDV